MLGNSKQNHKFGICKNNIRKLYPIPQEKDEEMKQQDVPFLQKEKSVKELCLKFEKKETNIIMVDDSTLDDVKINSEEKPVEKSKSLLDKLKRYKSK